MIVQDIEDDMTCFVDTYVNAFREEVFILKRESLKLPIEVEVGSESEKGDLLTMYLDEDCCKDGSKEGILLISPARITPKFYVTLSFPCTNNIVEYEALF